MYRRSRSLIDLHSIVEELVWRGASVKFLKEGQTYSKASTPVAKLMLGLLGAVASKTPSPVQVQLGSLRVHGTYGIGLRLSGVALNRFMPRAVRALRRRNPKFSKTSFI
ncbi:recombinase family protein [Corynebacterium auriscanis]|uniref:recombinase family protein n=1 Tax=Corynebacterium auriscanis TaxID=99807 RepID=UPI0022469B5E|nr:recombinase family protein [Corynebacterium auriscanis]MCX2163897.1 recombinase family protein [Corynebacterium auriscanis]